MTRAEFCTKLAEARKNSHIKQIEICTQMQMMPSGIVRMEQGLHSFNMKMCINYISTLKHHLLLTSGDKQTYVQDYSQLVQYLIEQRTGKYTQRSLATKAGVTNIAIANMERGKSIMSIDTLLALASALDIQITIKPINYA